MKLKKDNQQRTTYEGFRYSNSDPANRGDPNPVSFSYIDLVFEGRREQIERAINRSRGQERIALDQRFQELLETIDRREQRAGRRVEAFRVADLVAGEPEYGPVMMLTLIFVAGVLVAHLIGSGLAFAGTILLANAVMVLLFVDLSPRYELVDD